MQGRGHSRNFDVVTREHWEGMDEIPSVAMLFSGDAFFSSSRRFNAFTLLCRKILFCCANSPAPPPPSLVVEPLPLLFSFSPFFAPSARSARRTVLLCLQLRRAVCGRNYWTPLTINIDPYENTLASVRCARYRAADLIQ